MSGEPLVGFSIYNQLAPPGSELGGGPRTIRNRFDFTVAQNYEFDLEQESELQQLGFIQSLYVDNADNTGSVTIVTRQTQQRIIVPPKTLGYFAILSSLPNFTISCDKNTEFAVIHFINVPMASQIWTLP